MRQDEESPWSVVKDTVVLNKCWCSSYKRKGSLTPPLPLTHLLSPIGLCVNAIHILFQDILGQGSIHIFPVNVRIVNSSGFVEQKRFFFFFCCCCCLSPPSSLQLIFFLLFPLNIYHSSLVHRCYKTGWWDLAQGPQCGDPILKLHCPLWEPPGANGLLKCGQCKF